VFSGALGVRNNKMKKTIKELRITSVILFLLCISFAIGCQYSLLIHQDIVLTEQQKQQRIEFIKTTQDIVNLRKVSLLLLESDIDKKNYINESIESARNITLVFSFFSGCLVFYSIRLKKQFLTSA
jgi:hypothetical protein